MLARRRVLVGLLLLTALGGALRVAEAASPNRPQSADERAYSRLARGLAETGSYVYAGSRGGADTLHWAPGAPVAFAAAHLVAPTESPAVEYDVPSAYAVQVLAGTAAISLTFVLGALIAGPLAGLVAAGLLAIYPPAIRSVGDLLSEPLGTLALLAALIAVALALRRLRPRWLVAAGAAAGVAALVRGDLLFLPLALALLAGVVAWRRGTRGRPALLACACVAVGAVLAVLPWSVNASLESGRFVPVTTGGAGELWIGTFLPGEGRLARTKLAMQDEVRARFPGQRATPVQELPARLVLQVVAERRPGLDEDAALRAEALDNLREFALGDPLSFAAMMVRKVDWTWLSSSRGSGRERVAGEAELHLVLVLLCALGLLIGLVRSRSVPLWIAATALLYVTAINAVFVPEARHNLPFVPVLLAAGMGGLVLAVRARRDQGSGAETPAARRSSSTT